MKRFFKRMLSALCAFVLTISFAWSVQEVKADAASGTLVQSLTEKEYQTAGASVRIKNDGKNGIRFHILMLKTVYEQICDDPTFESYTLIYPTTALGDSELTEKTSDVMKITTTDIWKEYEKDSTYMESVAYVYSLPQTKFATNLSYRGLVKCDGVSKMTETASRCMAYVAKVALEANDGDETILKSYIPTYNVVYKQEDDNQLAQEQVTYGEVAANAPDAALYWSQNGEYFNIKQQLMLENYTDDVELRQITNLTSFSTPQTLIGSSNCAKVEKLVIINYNDFQKSYPNSSFTWNYESGDLIQTYTEGTTYFLIVSGGGVLTPTSMKNWFSEKFTNLKEVEFPALRTDNVTIFSSAFNKCTVLTSIDLSNFDTSNATEMSYMFYKCEKLTNLDLSNFDTSKVTNMSHMFQLCRGLKELDLTSFDTSQVTTMQCMFTNADSLEVLDISSFNTSNVENMYCMFSVTGSYVSSLKTIYVGEGWNTDKLTTASSHERMFENCKKIVGGTGTTYNASKLDKSAAHTGDGGYLTLKK